MGKPRLATTDSVHLLDPVATVAVIAPVIGMNGRICQPATVSSGNGKPTIRPRLLCLRARIAPLVGAVPGLR
jgi:hypothetical protein